MANFENTVALITGANKGIGLEIASQIGAHGAQIILGARNRELGEAAAATLRDKGANVEVQLIDLCDPNTAIEAASAIEARYGKLDILVNNAGGNDPGDGPPSRANLDAVRRIFDANFFGTLQVTQAMLPLLRKSTVARIVNISSGLGSLTQNGDLDPKFVGARKIGYNASKAALNMLTVQLAAELKESNICVNSVNPGFTSTANNGFRGTQTVAEGAAEAIRLALIESGGPTGLFFCTGGQEPW